WFPCRPASRIARRAAVTRSPAARRETASSMAPHPRELPGIDQENEYINFIVQHVAGLPQGARPSVATSLLLAAALVRFDDAKSDICNKSDSSPELLTTVGPLPASYPCRPNQPLRRHV